MSEEQSLISQASRIIVKHKGQPSRAKEYSVYVETWSVPCIRQFCGIYISIVTTQGNHLHHFKIF